MTRIPATKGVRRRESGFALLVIFLIAAAVAFTMYQELPRAAFESARDKEQLLIDRGNQYKRAIEVFYAVNKRYPAEIKDSENTNDKRFLRHRYLDPMTGKDEWRLIHTNGSFLTDSLVTKPPTQNARRATACPAVAALGANNLNTAPAAPTAASSAANPAANPNDPAAAAVPAPLNAAAQRRPSDRGFPTGPGFPQPPGASIPGNGANLFGANPANFNPDDPSTWPPITLAPPAAQPGPGQPAARNRTAPWPTGDFSDAGAGRSWATQRTRRLESATAGVGQPESVGAERPGGGAGARSISAEQRREQRGKQRDEQRGAEQWCAQHEPIRNHAGRPTGAAAAAPTTAASFHCGTPPFNPNQSGKP